MGILSNLLSGGATSLVDAVGDAIDKVATSDQERLTIDMELRKAEMQHEEKLADIDRQNYQTQLADVADARGNQTKIQESEHASWLSKNIHPILSIVIISAMFWMFGFLLFKGTPEGNRDVIMLVVGSITTIGVQVVTYYYGSSSGSADKTRVLSGYIKKG